MTGLLQSKAALFALLALASLLFFERALENGAHANTLVSRTDQGAYINYAIKLKSSGYTDVGSRNRMPLYPLFISLFIEPQDTPASFFDRGKVINTGLSFAGLCFIGVVFFRHLPRHHALNLLLFTAFTVFLFKAPHVQAEILYYLLTFAGFLICWRLFQKPSWWLAGLLGVIFGLTHLTKASVLPGIFCFVVFYTLDTLWKNRPAVTQVVKRWSVAIISVLLFVAVIFPYISKSKEIYGHYFYNVNSTFYFWCDSWDEAEARTKAAGDRTGWPKLKPEDTPSLSTYLRTHTTWDIVDRIFTGMSRVSKSMFHSYGYYGILWAYTLFAVGLLIWKRRLAWRLFLRRPMPVLAIPAYFFGYFLLIAWYSQIISGNRFILGLFLPWLFTLAMISVPFARRVKLTIAGKNWPLLTTFNSIISLWLLIEILVNCFHRVPTLYGGS